MPRRRGSTTVTSVANGLNQLRQQGGVALDDNSRGNLAAAHGASYGYDSQNQLRTHVGIS